MRFWAITSEMGISSLSMNKKAIPKPGNKEVLIRVRASSINYRDLMTVEDPKPRVPELPWCPNSDCSGVIEELGGACEGLSVGDRVMGCFFQNWSEGDIGSAAMSSALGGSLPGVLAEYVVLKADSVVKIPEYLDFISAAALPCAAVTAWHAMQYRIPIKKDENVLIMGTGGVSIFAQQFATILGAKTIVLSSSDHKLERIKKIGADYSINYNRFPDWEKKVTELTDGVGVDHILEVGGAGTLEKSILATRIGGHIALIGILAGASGKVVPTGIMRKSLNVSGIYVGSKTMFQNMLNVMDASKLMPIIDQTFSFNSVKDSFHLMKSGKHFGKIVISFDDA